MSKRHPSGMAAAIRIPAAGAATLRVEGRDADLTNLDKPFWPERGITKGDLIQYYADVAPVLLPHIARRAMVMKRYPYGAAGEFFFMKRAPSPRPGWIAICTIPHDSGSVIDFPMIDDLPSRRRSTASRSARRRACSSTTTGTHGAGRSRPSIPCVRRRSPASPRP
jgi:hypothetical protein